MDVLDSISKIIVDVLDEEDLVVTRDTTADDAEDWDSLAQIQIIVAIEKELGIKFSLQEIQQLNQADNVGNTVDLISQKLDAV
jgi:acyl carrier protein